MGSGPPCPKCGSTKSSVVDKRQRSQDVRRRRLCAECKQKFSTLEKTALMDGHLKGNDQLHRLGEAVRVLSVAIESVGELLKE